MDPSELKDALALPLADWLALGVLAAGIVAGAMAGLARAFGTLLWLLAALWLGKLLAPRVVGWLPNTADPADPAAQRMAFLAVAAVVLSLPVLGRLLGGSAGRKADGESPRHKPYGALVGLACSALLLLLALPWVRRIEPVERELARARAGAAAAGLAEHLSYLYPDAHRAALREGASGSPP